MSGYWRATSRRALTASITRRCWAGVRRRIEDKRVLALIKAFLKAGILTEHGGFQDTVTGTPQGGILSPLLANIALSALDEHFAQAWTAMGSEWQRRQRRTRGEATFRLVRYADDFVVVIAGRRTHAEALQAGTAAVLAPLGLTLSPEKTRITHIDEGIEFLGWRVQRRRASTGRSYVYTYASKPSLAAVKAKVKAITRSGPQQSLDQLLHRLNPGAAWLVRILPWRRVRAHLQLPARLHVAQSALLAAPQTP